MCFAFAFCLAITIQNGRRPETLNVDLEVNLFFSHFIEPAPAIATLASETTATTIVTTTVTTTTTTTTATTTTTTTTSTTTTATSMKTEIVTTTKINVSGKTL